MEIVLRNVPNIEKVENNCCFRYLSLDECRAVGNEIQLALCPASIFNFTYCVFSKIFFHVDASAVFLWVSLLILIVIDVMNTALKSFYGEDFLKYLENTYGQNGRYISNCQNFFAKTAFPLKSQF